MVLERSNQKFKFALRFPMLLALLICCTSGCEKATRSKTSTQDALQQLGLVAPIAILGSMAFTDGGTQTFLLEDGAGNNVAISLDYRIGSKTPGRIYVGSYPKRGRLTTKTEERAYIEVLRRAVDFYTPAQLADMAEKIEHHAIDDPLPTVEIAYVSAIEVLIERLGPSYQKYLDEHPSHQQAAKAREDEHRRALREATAERSDSAILRFVRVYPDSKLVPEALEQLRGYRYSKVKERHVLPYTVLAPAFRDRRKGPGGLTINGVRMDFEVTHGPWPKSTHFSKADNLGGVGARQSELNVATGGRIYFEQWAVLGKMICKGTVEFDGEGLALLPDTEIYLTEDVFRQ